MAYITKKVSRRLPDGHQRTFYARIAGLGDGPITSPQQNPTTGEIEMPDDYVGSTPAPTFDSSSSTTVATVNPIITGNPLDALVAGVKDAGSAIANLFGGGDTATAPVSAPAPGAPAAASLPTGMSDLQKLLIAAGLVGVGYYALGKRKRRSR